MFERRGNYITTTVLEGYGFLGWVARPDNFLISFVVFYGPIGFGDDTRIFMPFKMVLKVFKERDITGYLFRYIYIYIYIYI